MTTSKYAITGIARDGTGYPCRITKYKTKGCLDTRVQVEDRVLEGAAYEKDLKYIDENEFKKLVTKEKRRGAGRKSQEKRKTRARSKSSDEDTGAPRKSNRSDREDTWIAREIKEEPKERDRPKSKKERT